MTKYTLFRIKKDRLNQWNEWCFRLNTDLSVQAADTLVHEHIFSEAFLNFQIEETWYSIGVSFSEDSNEMPPQENLVINIEHKKQKQECLEFVTRGAAAYSLINPLARIGKESS